MHSDPLKLQLNDPISQNLCLWISNEAKKNSAIHKLILFGSRARQDHHERSDFDIAVSAPSWNHSEWAKWLTSIQEQAPTLLGLDLLWVKSVTNPDLLNKIKTEGILIHEKRESAPRI